MSIDLVLPSYNSKIENEQIALGLVLAKNSKSLTFSNVFFTFTQVIPQLTEVCVIFALQAYCSILNSFKFLCLEVFVAFCFFTLQEFLKKNCRKSTMIEIPVIIDSDSLNPLSVLLSKLSGSLFFQLFQTFSKKRKKIIKAILCNFSMRMLKYFFCQQKVKKPPSKVAQNSSNPLFFLTALTAQMATTEVFMFQNVAY